MLNWRFLGSSLLLVLALWHWHWLLGKAGTNLVSGVEAVLSVLIGWVEGVLNVKLGLTWIGGWHQILVWVETSEGSKICHAGDLDHWSEVLLWHLLEVVHTVHWHWWTTLVLVLISSMILVVLVGLMLLQLLWHWWKGNTIWKVWKWIDQLSLLLVTVIERASITELALSSDVKVLTWFSLVVRMDSTECSLSESLWKWVMWLSKFFWSVCELAELLEWALRSLEEMLAHLGLVLLSQSIEFGLITVEIIIV